MSRTNLLRMRRSAAQLHALEQVEREIRAADPYSRRKYLSEFSSAYPDYECVTTMPEVIEACRRADVVMVGDYHALPQSQAFASDMLRQLAAFGRRVALGVEFISARHQRALELWMAGKVPLEELRERVRFDLDWGYDWAPYRELLESARLHAEAVCALDCTPRSSLRRIAARDRHAATKIAEIRSKHPEALVLVLFGESHLAPEHLPGCLRALRPADRIVTVLQNKDNLYWQAAGEPVERVDAVRVKDDVLCVFTATPLEKYESYRLCIERWRQDRPSVPDVAPAIYNMAAALLRFLNADVFVPTTGAHAFQLSTEMPEVVWNGEENQLRRRMLLGGKQNLEIEAALSRMECDGVSFVPRLNTIFIRQLNLVHGAEEAARFVHHASRRAASEGRSDAPSDVFYRRVLEETLAYFGSRALYPGRKPVRVNDVHSLYSSPERSVVGMSHQDFLKAIDFLVLHKDYEANCRRYRERPALLDEAMSWTGPRWHLVVRWLGRMLGSEIYDAYVNGIMDKRRLRSLFLRRTDKPNSARTAYFVTVRQMRPRMGERGNTIRALL